MKKQGVNNAKVGLLVLAGGIFLIFSLYMIGRNRNIFGSSFTITAVIGNVNGIVPGNNVRYMGFDVGTVKSVTIASDTSFNVMLSINSKMKSYIRKNVIASAGTDGLMGNRLVNIQSQPGNAPAIEEGDFIRSYTSLDPDEMLRTLHSTNDNMERITANFFLISEKLNNSMSLWQFLADTLITRDLKQAVVDLRKAGSHAAEITLSAKKMTSRFENGEGLANTLFTDTALVHRLSASIEDLKKTSHQGSTMINDLQLLIQDMKQGQGTAGMLLTDSLLRNSLYQTTLNLEEGTKLFSQNMEALQSNFLFRRYFRKLEKQQKEQAKTGDVSRVNKKKEIN